MKRAILKLFVLCVLVSGYAFGVIFRYPADDPGGGSCTSFCGSRDGKYMCCCDAGTICLSKDTDCSCSL